MLGHAAILRLRSRDVKRRRDREAPAPRAERVKEPSLRGLTSSCPIVTGRCWTPRDSVPCGRGPAGMLRLLYHLGVGAEAARNTFTRMERSSRPTALRARMTRLDPGERFESLDVRAVVVPQGHPVSHLVERCLEASAQRAHLGHKHKRSIGEWIDSIGITSRIVTPLPDETFDAVEIDHVRPTSERGGGGGSRTRVRRCARTNVYACRSLFDVSNSSVTTDLRVQQADKISIFLCQRVRRSSLIVAALRSYRRKLRAPSSRLVFRRRREQQRRCYRSQLQVAHFYVAMGATTRNSYISIPVETGTPPSFQRRTNYADARGIWSSTIVTLDVRAPVA